MKIQYKCKNKKVTTKDFEEETYTVRSYNEYSAMHYDNCSGWSESMKTTYTINNCKECGKSHILSDYDVKVIK